MINALRLLSAGAILAGFIIGIVCARFMWATDIVNVTGAGLGCITGAILIAAGLQSLATLAARTPQ